MRSTHTALGTALLAAGALALAGCGGDTISAEEESGTSGVVTFAMTDAPVDEAYAVVIAMTEFELKPVDGESFRIPVNEAGRELDLLQLTNGESATIIEDEDIPAGEYEWLRIHFDKAASYVQLEEGGGQYGFFMPSGAQTGYKVVGGLEVPVNESVEYILDFDLRRSLLAPPGLRRGPFGEDRAFLLKPTVRMMNRRITGGVRGLVAEDLLAMNNVEACGVDGVDAVYAFEGFDVDPLGVDVVPLVSDLVEPTMDATAYEYVLRFLLPGEYTLGFTCVANLDDGVVEDYPAEGLVFSETANVEIVAGEVKSCDLPRPEGADPC